MVRVIKTEYSDVVIISEGIKGNKPFVIPLTELRQTISDLKKIARDYEVQIDKAIEYRTKQTEEIMKLIEPVYEKPLEQWEKDLLESGAQSAASEFNENWTSFEADLNGAQRTSYLELSQANKQKAFDYWMRTQGGHVDYSATYWYQRNYEQEH